MKLLLITLHLAFVAVWLGSLLYVPRLFAGHAAASDEGVKSRMDDMAHLLYFSIASPAGVLAVAFGIALIFYGFDGGWLPVKLSFVLLLVAFHVYCGKLFRELVHGENPHGSRFYHALTWIPASLILPIVMLVVTRPF